MSKIEIEDAVSLADLIDSLPSSDDLAWDHAMDISGSIYTRLKELGISKGELADRLGVSPGRVSQIIKGDPGMSLKTLARLECALDFRLDGGFHYNLASSHNGSPYASADFITAERVPSARVAFQNLNLSLDSETTEGALMAA